MNILVTEHRHQILPSAVWAAIVHSLYICYRAWGTAIKKSFKDQKQTLRHDCSVCEEGVNGFSLHKQQLVEEMEAMNMSRASV